MNVIYVKHCTFKFHDIFQNGGDSSKQLLILVFIYQFSVLILIVPFHVSITTRSKADMKITIWGNLWFNMLFPCLKFSNCFRSVYLQIFTYVQHCKKVGDISEQVATHFLMSSLLFCLFQSNLLSIWKIFYSTISRALTNANNISHKMFFFDSSLSNFPPNWFLWWILHISYLSYFQGYCYSTFAVVLFSRLVFYSLHTSWFIYYVIKWKNNIDVRMLKKKWTIIVIANHKGWNSNWVKYFTG